MMTAFFVPFVSICLAELLDKSQLTILLLSTRVKHHFLLFVGAVIAFLLVDGLAILFGSFLTTLIPKVFLSVGAGLLFLFFGWQSLRTAKKDAKKTISVKKTAFVSGFLAVFLSEWGDKTQLASAVFATQYQPVLVFLGVMAALTLLSFSAVYAGKLLLKKVKRDKIEKLAGFVFIAIGIVLLATSFL